MHLRQEFIKDADKLLQLKILEPSVSSFCSLTVMIKKVTLHIVQLKTFKVLISLTDGLLNLCLLKQRPPLVSRILVFFWPCSPLMPLYEWCEKYLEISWTYQSTLWYVCDYSYWNADIKTLMEVVLLCIHIGFHIQCLGFNISNNCLCCQTRKIKVV